MNSEKITRDEGGYDNPGQVQGLPFNGEVPAEQDNGAVEEHIVTPKAARFPLCRHVLAGMAFLGFLNVYCLRVNLSVALVAMVNNTGLIKNHTDDSECPGTNQTNVTATSSKQGEFPWNADQQGLILGSFFYGYIVTQLPGGWLAERYGGKFLFGFGVLGTSLLTLVTPFAARAGLPVLVACRILEGLGEGVTFPAMHAMLAKWAPPLERSKLGTFVYAGAQLGTVVSLPLSGYLCSLEFLGGWPLVFYVFGVLGCIWFVLWMIFAFNSPAQHPRISKVEREAIEKSIGYTPKKALPTPWASIFTSVPFWGLLVCHFCQNWGFYTLLTCLPTYMKEVLKFDISQNGMLSALPYFFAWLSFNVAGQIADFLRFNHYLTTTTVRKLFNLIGLGLPAVFLVVVGNLGCNKVLSVLFLTLAVGTGGLSAAGFNVNHLDIAPPFAGTLLGLTNAAATIPGFVGPQVVGLLTYGDPSRLNWQKVFYISSAIYAFGGIQFAIFGSGKLQTWAQPKGLLETEPLLVDPDDEKPSKQR